MRDLVRDACTLAEQLIMYDMPRGWEVAPTLSSREVAAPFFPDRIAEIAEDPAAASCYVREQRKLWSVELARRREVTVEEWIDTAVGTEKAAGISLWRRGIHGKPTIVVAFRGSKSANDWVNTNFKNLTERKGIELSEAALAALPHGPSEAAHAIPLDDAFDLPSPGVPLTVWRAYAGGPGRAEQSPRGRIRRVLERLLREQPAYARGGILITGHSLGGALANLCAFDLLSCSTAVAECGITLVPVSSPPMFNLPFQQRMDGWQAEGRLVGLHVTAAGDFAPKIKGSIAEAVAKMIGLHAVRDRLVLNAADSAKPIYFVAAGEDDECADLARLPFDQFGHNQYAKDLSALHTPGRGSTVPADWPWPVPLR